ncbi:MAG: NADH-quinone oxidoreductase subunit C [Elusimicrobia bacterium]|nr:NADH-quinone oxidoreductase subunit C [Elusimicrobiota bacterium]
MSLELSSVKADLDAFCGAPLAARGTGFDTVWTVPAAQAHGALERLKSRHGFNMLADLTCVDLQGFGKETGAPSPAPAGARFKLVYRLSALDPATGLLNARLALDAWVDGDAGPVSAGDLFPCADWLEREVWDMFGVSFSDRPDITRILMYPEFVGHPLRKDYPIKKRQPLIGPPDGPPRERLTEADLRPRIVE